MRQSCQTWKFCIFFKGQHECECESKILIHQPPYLRKPNECIEQASSVNRLGTKKGKSFYSTTTLWSTDKTCVKSKSLMYTALTITHGKRQLPAILPSKRI